MDDYDKIKHYAGDMYDRIGYVTLDHLMENTGCDKTEIIDCLMNEGYECVRDGVYTIYEIL